MKSKASIIKYIFILFVIFIIGFAIYKINDKKENNEAIGNESNTGKAQTSQKITHLRLGISNFDNINPISSQNKDVINLSTILYEPLLSITEDYQIKKALAEEWSKINETSYIIKLRSNLKWEDGSNLTSTDVKFTIDKIKEGKSIYSANAKNIKSTEIIDERTIRIYLNKEEPFFEYNLIFPIISSKQFSPVKNFYSSRMAPMATGMYKVKSASKDSMELIRNDNWYNASQEKYIIETIKINFYKTMGDVYNAFKISNIDMICTSNLKINDYIGTIGFATKDYKGRELDFISLNCTQELLKEKEVRQAIYYAIDKKNIVSSVYENQYYISSFPTDYGSYLYTKENKTTYNQVKSKKILEGAGWTYAYGVWRKKEGYTTKTLQFNLVVESANKDRVKVAKLIKKQLEAIGIGVNIYEVSNTAYKDYLKNKNYDMILTGIYNGYSPDLSYFLGNDNIANYKNEEILQLLEDIKNVSDEELLKEKYNRIIEIYENEIPYVCLYRNKGKVIYNMRMFGNFNPNSYTAYYNFNNWYRQ